MDELPVPPSKNQAGDILPTVWADDGYQYTIMDDGGTDVPKGQGLWRQSVARISGTPPNISFTHVGDPSQPPPHTFAQIHADPSIWRGPLGPFYSSGLVEADHVFYATQQLNWNWNANGRFGGLEGIAYSTDDGQHWRQWTSASRRRLATSAGSSGARAARIPMDTSTRSPPSVSSTPAG